MLRFFLFLTKSTWALRSNLVLSFLALEPHELSEQLESIDKTEIKIYRTIYKLSLIRLPFASRFQVLLPRHLEQLRRHLFDI